MSLLNYLVHWKKIEFLPSVIFLEIRTNNHYVTDTILPLVPIMISADSKVRKDKFLSSFGTRIKSRLNNAKE